mmetsp:Transcript_68605/g.121182  ORF Transcript_68605/g.121182 Transcript_68605/m.121182 type:complete len:206 (+) Transcript_68605:1475-2092(+)
MSTRFIVTLVPLYVFSSIRRIVLYFLIHRPYGERSNLTRGRPRFDFVPAIRQASARCRCDLRHARLLHLLRILGIFTAIVTVVRIAMRPAALLAEFVCDPTIAELVHGRIRVASMCPHPLEGLAGKAPRHHGLFRSVRTLAFHCRGSCLRSSSSITTFHFRGSCLRSYGGSSTATPNALYCSDGRIKRLGTGFLAILLHLLLRLF